MELNSHLIVELSKDRVRDVSNANVKELSLEFQNIVQIASDAFNQYRNLRHLYLSNNDIVNILENMFSPLENLGKLDLSDNKIVELHANIFKRNVKLEYVDLHNNAIEVIHPDTFSNLNQLKYLSLEKNKLKKLPENLFQSNIALFRIDLDCNALEELNSNIFSHNKKLEEIYIQNNKIKSFHSDTFKQLPKLIRLNISDNSVRKFNFIDLKGSFNLQEFGITNNELKEINETNNLKSLYPNLKTIYLDGNKFQCSMLKMIIESVEQQGINVDGVDKSKGVGVDHVFGIKCWPDTYEFQVDFKTETEKLRNENHSMQKEIHYLGESVKLIKNEFYSFKDSMTKQMQKKNAAIEKIKKKYSKLARKTNPY